MKKSEIIKQLENTIAKLSKNPAEADTVKALKKQLAEIMPCTHGEYTNEPFTGCKTCGSPKIVICNHKKVIGKRRNFNGCNTRNCKYFTPLKTIKIPRRGEGAVNG